MMHHLARDVCVQVKQRNTPDPGVSFGPEGIKRSACQLPDGASTAFFWDDNTAPKSVVARLASDGPGRWEWSGGFALPEKEDYLGLRMHHTDALGVRDGQTVIVPVSIAVDASKVVLISFKARQNLPPYKIRNSCAAVDIIVSQQVDSVRSVRLPPCRVCTPSLHQAQKKFSNIRGVVSRNAVPHNPIKCVMYISMHFGLCAGTSGTAGARPRGALRLGRTNGRAQACSNCSDVQREPRPGRSQGNCSARDRQGHAQQDFSACGQGSDGETHRPRGRARHIQP